MDNASHRRLQTLCRGTESCLFLRNWSYSLWPFSTQNKSLISTVGNSKKFWEIQREDERGSPSKAINLTSLRWNRALLILRRVSHWTFGLRIIALLLWVLYSFSLCEGGIHWLSFGSRIALHCLCFALLVCRFLLWFAPPTKVDDGTSREARHSSPRLTPDHQRIPARWFVLSIHPKLRR